MGPACLDTPDIFFSLLTIAWNFEKNTAIDFELNPSYGTRGVFDRSFCAERLRVRMAELCAAHGRTPRKLGGRLRKDNWSAKAEWIEGRNIRGMEGWTERVYYVFGPSLGVQDTGARTLRR